MIDLGRLRIASATPRLLDWGATQVPILGAPAQRLTRMGARYAVDIQLAPLEMEDDGRRLISRLSLAKQQGARLRWPQLDFDPGVPGRPSVRIPVAGGMTLPITGGQAGYRFREGQFISVAKGSRSYLYGVTEGALLAQDGAADLPLSVPLRATHAVGDAVEVALPMIEGYLSGDELAWSLEITRTVGLSFTITERA